MAEPQDLEKVELDWGPADGVGQSEPPLDVKALTPADWAGTRIRAANAETTLRVWMCAVLAMVFVGLNIGVGTLVYLAYLSDLDLLKLNVISADERLISEKTFISLIAATVVQVGAGITVIVKYLFPARPG